MAKTNLRDALWANYVLPGNDFDKYVEMDVQLAILIQDVLRKCRLETSAEIKALRIMQPLVSKTVNKDIDTWKAY